LGPRHREEQVKFVIAYGGAKPGHANFADIVAADDEVIERLERCERRLACEADSRGGGVPAMSKR
jgi:hypothetical protein